MKWEKVNLGEISLNIQTGPFGSQLHQSDYTDLGIPVIMPKDIQGGVILEDSIARVDELKAKDLARHKTNFDDIIYPRRGDIAKCAIIKDGQVGWLCGTGCLKVTIDLEKANSAFVFYQLNTYEKTSWMEKHAVGATMLNLNAGILGSVPIELPPLPIQQRIASILSRYDDLIENYQQQIKLLEEAAQRLYKEWFVDLHFPGYEDTKIVDGVPEGWEKGKVGDICGYIRGKSYTSKELSDNGTLMVNLKNIQSYGGYKVNVEKRFLGDYKVEQQLFYGDLVMGVTDMTQERRLVGHVALIPKLNEVATFSMDLIKIVSNELPTSFLYCYFRFGGLSKKISPLANGVNVLHLKPEILKDIEIIVPQSNLVKQFSNSFESLFEKVTLLNSQINLLTEARDRLLPKLMSGEIEV